MEYNVKKEWWFCFMINVIALASACCALMVVDSVLWMVLMYGLAILIFGLFNTAFFGTTCVLTEDAVIYRTGMFCYKIKYDTITKVEKAGNLYSSLALSWNRVRIVSEEKGKMKVRYISVEKQDEFVEELLKRATKNIKSYSKTSKKSTNEEQTTVENTQSNNDKK